MQTFGLSSPITKADMAEFEATQNNPNPDAIPDTLVSDPSVQNPTPPANMTADEVALWKKRHADSQRYINELKTKQADREKELLDKLKEATAQTNHYVSPEALKGFEEAFPDVAPFLKEYNEKAKVEAQRYADKRIEEALSEREKKSQENSQAIKRLTERHPDWPEYVENTTPGGEIFARWLESQTPYVNEMITSGEVDKVILVLDLFKSQGLGIKPVKPSGKTKQELTQAVQPTNTQVNITTPKSGFDMAKFNRDYDVAAKKNNPRRMGELIAEYEQAEREGRI